MKTFNVVIDTREQQPLEFNHDSIASVESRKLSTGDYSIVGLEDVLCIERKASLMEIYGNIIQPRFWKELERMRTYKYRFIVMEFSFEDIQNFPYSLGVPKSVWSKLTLTPQFLMSSISKMQVDYNTNVVFANNRDIATDAIINIMKRVYANSQ